MESMFWGFWFTHTTNCRFVKKKSRIELKQKADAKQAHRKKKKTTSQILHGNQRFPHPNLKRYSSDSPLGCLPPPLSPEGGAGRRGNKKQELPTSVSLLRFSGWKTMRVGNADSLHSVGVLCVCLFFLRPGREKGRLEKRGGTGPFEAQFG